MFFYQLATNMCEDEPGYRDIMAEIMTLNYIANKLPVEKRPAFAKDLSTFAGEMLVKYYRK